jgi:hypothetical protein
MQHVITKHYDLNTNKYPTRRIIMLSFLKRIFGAKPAEPTEAPYKVEGSEHFPFPKAVADEKPVAKKPAVKKTVAKKPAAKRPAKKSAQ